MVLQQYPSLKNTPKQQAFLAAYAKLGNITVAAQAANINRDSHQAWLADPDYRAQFETAREEACDLLVEEARKRATEGEKPSDVLLMFLIKGARPDVYRDTWKGEIKHSGTVASVDLSKLTDVQLEQLRAITASVECEGRALLPQGDELAGDRSGDSEEGEE